MWKIHMHKNNAFHFNFKCLCAHIDVLVYIKKESTHALSPHVEIISYHHLYLTVIAFHTQTHSHAYMHTIHTQL